MLPIESGKELQCEYDNIKRRERTADALSLFLQFLKESIALVWK